jgi:hypothetical protein
MVHSRRQTGRKTDTKVKSTELQPGEKELTSHRDVERLRTFREVPVIDLHAQELLIRLEVKGGR